MGFNGGKQGQDRKLLVDVDNLKGLKDVFASGLTYFTAERQGPRYEYDRKSAYEDGCGCKGENTGNVISDNWNSRVAGSKLLKEKDSEELFNIALDDWVDYIFPGVNVRVQPVGAQSYQVLIRDGFHNVQTDSTNIGFGYYEIEYAKFCGHTRKRTVCAERDPVRQSASRHDERRFRLSCLNRILVRDILNRIR